MLFVTKIFTYKYLGLWNDNKKLWNGELRLIAGILHDCWADSSSNSALSFPAARETGTGSKNLGSV